VAWSRKTIYLAEVPALSSDGNYVAVVDGLPEGCVDSASVGENGMGTACDSYYLTVLDASGNESLHLGPFDGVNAIQLTKNGRYGRAFCGDIKHHNTYWILFDVEKKSVCRRSVDEMLGTPLIHESGELEVINSVTGKREKRTKW